MKRKFTSILSIILAIPLSFGSFSVSALYITGDTVAAYKVKDSEVHVLGDGLTYNEFSYNDAKGVEQVCFTMEFNPKSSDFRTYVYHTKASYGYTIAQDAENAQKAGLQVYAAINGDFFSMDAANYGTPNNTYITEGKVMATSVNVKKDYKFIVAPDGTADVVESKPIFTLKIGSVDYTSSFGYINKRPITLEDKFYYFDNDCNATDPVVSNCSEIVCTYESARSRSEIRLPARSRR